VLGPRAAGRAAVIPRRPEAVDEGAAAGRSEGTGPRAEPSPGSLGLPSESSMLAALLRRVFALDVFQCPRSGGRRRIVGVHTGGERLRGLARAARVRDRLAIRAAVAPAAATGSVAEHAPRPGIPSPDPDLAPSSASRLPSGSGRSRLHRYEGTVLDGSPPF
jgi:hypothetical protein